MTIQAAGARWTIRIAVLVAFAVTCWRFGPRAVDVLAARLDGGARSSPEVVLDRAVFADRPEWLAGDLLLAVARDVQPVLQGSVRILDDAAARRLQTDLRAVPWVREAALERVFPDRFRIRCDLRRPVLAVKDGQGRPLALCDRNAVCLPFVEVPGLPAVVLYAEGGPTTVACPPGQACADDRVVAAVATVLEWRDELAPLVPGVPQLLEVDASNLDHRWMYGPHYPEIRVKLRRDDGAAVVFAYDHPPGSRFERVPVATKAGILGKVLAANPGLHGLVAGDLRFERCWQAWLQPRAGPDPAGPWATR